MDSHIEANDSTAGDDRPGDRATDSGAGAAHRSALAAIGAIEKRELKSCPHCHGTALQRWGTGRKGVRRWWCRGCRRSFSATTGTVIAGLHAPRRFAAVLADMMSDKPSSCRRLAEALKISRMTAWAWRQRISDGFVANSAAASRRPLADAGWLVVRESRKASREWAEHRRDSATYPKPDRHRWIDYRRYRLPLPRPMTPYLIPVVLMRDRFRACHVWIVPDPGTKPEKRGVSGLQPREVSLACAESTSATSMDALPSPIGARSERSPILQTANLASHAANASAADCLKSFLAPFRGPASKYLFRYVAWFVTRLNGSDGAIERHLLSQECALPKKRILPDFPVTIDDCRVT